MGLKVNHVYTVPITKNLRYYVYGNTSEIRIIDSSNDITYQFDFDELLVGGLKIVAINIFRHKTITAKDLIMQLLMGSLAELSQL
ncbi:hypothetical protein CmeUKMEL1_05740 [Cryptosporidium meleagridis]|uniref:Uncharacterized protein n=1 Tax=Cryptosporidium meleagridis TaxID=93969 RepID=A0A2P4YZ83_9CRYT|nr:hypothetical protein CmeUKMEL1_05740 [Cryptosporidium meleagridis]